jgi:hypothetical protein
MSEPDTVTLPMLSMLSEAAAEEVGMLDASSNPGNSRAITAKAAASFDIFISNRHPSLFDKTS